jgi:hypothetical protein
MVRNIAVDPGLDTSNLVQGVSEVSGVGQSGLLAYKLVLFLFDIDCVFGGDGQGTSSIIRAQCIGQRKDRKLFWCTAVKVYRSGTRSGKSQKQRIEQESKEGGDRGDRATVW